MFKTFLMSGLTVLAVIHHETIEYFKYIFQHNISKLVFLFNTKWSLFCPILLVSLNGSSQVLMHDGSRLVRHHTGYLSKVQTSGGAYRGVAS